MLQEEFMVLGLKVSKFNQEQQHPCTFGNSKVKPNRFGVLFFFLFQRAAITQPAFTYFPLNPLSLLDKALIFLTYIPYKTNVTHLQTRNHIYCRIIYRSRKENQNFSLRKKKKKISITSDEKGPTILIALSLLAISI